MTILIYYAVTGNAFSTISRAARTIPFSNSAFIAQFFFLSVCANIYCFEKPYLDGAFYSAGAYAAQHLAVNLTRLLLLAPFLENLLALAPYVSFIAETLVCAFVYFGVYFLLVRNKTAQEKDHSDKNAKVVVFRS